MLKKVISIPVSIFYTILFLVIVLQIIMITSDKSIDKLFFSLFILTIIVSLIEKLNIKVTIEKIILLLTLLFTESYIVLTTKSAPKYLILYNIFGAYFYLVIKFSKIIEDKDTIHFFISLIPGLKITSNDLKKIVQNYRFTRNNNDKNIKNDLEIDSNEINDN